jgi:hypothetical protein
MEEIARPWTSTEPLEELSLFSDWDSVASMIAALRIHLFEHGTIPTWSFLFCGGQPELSVPFSWAYTWPSLFAYALPPNHAIIAAWIAMTVVGFLATRALLRGWTGSALGAVTGAGLYVCSGIFANAFNQGHVSWAFFHLVPALMLVFERAFDRSVPRRRSVGRLFLVTLVSFLFFSAGLPHGLMHFYPAFLLLAALRIGGAARASTWGRSVAAVAPVLMAHLLGLWLAAYKLWPVVRWQLDAPRHGVWSESRDLALVLWNTVTWAVTFTRGPNAYVGPGAWALALCAIAGAAWSHRPGRTPRHPSPAAGATLFGSGLVAAGLALCLGNENPLGPAYLFRYVPLFSGVRAFLRYQILVVFGLSVLAAVGVSMLDRWLPRTRPGRAAVAAAALVALAPVVLQAALMAWNVPAEPKARIAAKYALADHPRPPEMVMMFPRDIYSEFVAHPGPVVTLLERGYWIANCRSDLTLPHHRFFTEPLRYPRFQRPYGWTVKPGGSTIPLSVPPPIHVERITRNAVTLRYPPGLDADILLNLPVLKTFRFNAPAHPYDQGRVRFRAKDLPEGRLTITAAYPGPAAGAVASAAGLVATVAFFFVVSRRRPGSGEAARQ